MSDPARPPAPTGSVLRPALLLTSGRMLAYGAAFLVPVVLARVLSPELFGTYKQLFVLFATLYYTAQIGIATSLFYFVPRAPQWAGRYVANAFVLLAVSGVFCGLLLATQRDSLGWLFSNGTVGVHTGALGAYLALMLISSPLEVLLVARHRYRAATWSYALSDVARALLLLAPALLTGELGWLMAGAVTFAAGRALVSFGWFRREFGAQLRADAQRAREQLAYSLPFGIAVAIGTLQLHLHEYVVSHSFDAATFAIYAVGCLQIPLVDFVATPACEVMMVRMSEQLRDGRQDAALATWHDAVGSLALMFFPLVALLLLGARDLIVLLFTSTYAASVPIFELWCLSILFTPLVGESVLRVYAQMRLLVGVNVLQFAVVAVLVVPALSLLGLRGAVLASLVALAVARFAVLGRVARLLGVGWRGLLPWRELGLAGAASVAAALIAGAARDLLATGMFARLAVLGTVFTAVYLALALWWGLGPDLLGPLRRGLGRFAAAPAPEAGAS